MSRAKGGVIMAFPLLFCLDEASSWLRSAQHAPHSAWGKSGADLVGVKIGLPVVLPATVLRMAAQLFPFVAEWMCLEKIGLV